MSTETLNERLTYDQWRLLPETTQPYEIVDGNLRMSPTPTSDHQWILRRIFKFVDAFVDSRGLGIVFFAPLDVVIQKEPLRTRQPDLLFLSA
ncbi:MAG TPA: Uma2 family endonuclease, partial [Armatimonadota bacterium]|nr:Uma2 family endonuclease [Armatimonadota bacterium]